MFSHPSTILAVAFLAFTQAAVATTTVTVTPVPTPTPIPASECNANALQCCNDVEESNSTPVQQICGLLGITLVGVTALAGLSCTPITVVGSGATCSAQPLCCENNDFNGLVAFGCVPVTLS